MHLHWERSNNSAGDCSINGLSWMGKVPEEIPEDEGWKLSRNNYYQEGWLATANMRGVVGVTYTTSFCAGSGQNVEFPARTNYNLRGHRSEVTMVKWNEPYQKLASCDSTGIIFVWIKYEGRWSIELINDRNTPVTSFSWSHDGRMALICYQDGFVLVGSVAGQRYWSTMLPPEATVTCGTWSPDDQLVYIGTAQGGLVVMDVHGNIVSKVSISSDTAITDLQWSCEKFVMEERDNHVSDFIFRPETVSSRVYSLAISFKNGDIKLVNGYDDIAPVLIRTGFQTMQTEWSNSGELLAVAGRVSHSQGDLSPGGQHLNRVSFYNSQGALLATFIIPYFKSAVTALTWGHNDKRLFVATGTQVHIGWISKKIPSLQLLCRLKIHKTLGDSFEVDCLPLPCRLKSLISSLFTHSIKCHIPEKKNLRKFVSRPPCNGLRLYCTMIRHGDEATGSNYTIYLEHLGGFLPILKGKKTSKLKPEFVIFDPLKDIENSFQKPRPNGMLTGSLDVNSDTDFTDQEDSPSPFYSPRLRRRNRRRRFRRNQPHYFGYIGNEEVDYVNNLPEEGRMVEVKSNIWGTKFKLHGLDSSLPPLLGQISYKASLLHLQPRQMRLIVTEMRDDVSHTLSNNINSCSEDEEENDKLLMEDEMLTAVTQSAQAVPTIAPLPAVHNRLSVMDFQRIQNDIRATDNTLPGDSWPLPQVEVTVADTPTEVLPPGTNLGFETDLATVSCHKIRKLVTTGLVTGGNTVHGHMVSQVTDSGHNWCSLTGSKSFDCERLVETSTAAVIDVSGVTGVTGGLRSGRNRVRRDSVGASSGSGSTPGSAVTSPRRWAAKPDQLDTEPNIFPVPASTCPTGSSNTCPRSCSADHLGAIVDILGVPNSAPQLWDNPRRLILSAEKKKIEMKRNLAKVGKSKSLDTEESSMASISMDPDIIKDCRSKHRPGGNCSNCAETDNAKDLELNKEMFDVSSPVEEENDAKPLLPDNMTPRTKRKFDSVRCLLEKARAKLSRSRNNCSEDSEELLKASAPSSPVHLPRNKLQEQRLSVPDQHLVSQSSPNTPLMARKLQSRRHQSFSPVRTLLNSPLLRRKKSLFDSSDEDVSDSERMRQRSRSRTGYQNLETFQKQKLKQKLRKLSHLENSEFNDELRGGLLGASLGESPEGSPRKFQRQARQFVMHNKAPLWNEGSQVYQLDFGGRVTQESAKNFQIEHSGKQVMQFGRIDENAYTLDFQYPLTALQAFSVALANVTQRLK